MDIGVDVARDQLEWAEGHEGKVRCVPNKLRGIRCLVRRFTTLQPERIVLESTLVKLCYYRRLTPLKELIKQVQGEGTGTPEPPKSPPNPGTGSEGKHEKPAEETAPAPPKEREPAQPAENDQKPTEPAAQREDDVLQDPAVQNFMQTFKAQILSVERKKGEKVAARDLKDLAE